MMSVYIHFLHNKHVYSTLFSVALNSRKKSVGNFHSICSICNIVARGDLEHDAQTGTLIPLNLSVHVLAYMIFAKLTCPLFLIIYLLFVRLSLLWFK